MAKIMDVPMELREFNKVFNQIGGYRWDVAVVFDDLLDFMIACLSPSGDKELADRLKAKYKDEYKYFSGMMSEMVKAYRDGTKRRNWFDGLGLYYECIASHSKAKRLGQFFTPETLCDLMAMIVINDDSQPIDTRKKINDPACGSGRLLLAYHAIAPQNLHYGGDIDAICAKMTAINMCLHGMKGQAICGDALWLHEDWRFGFSINRMLKYGIPSIEKITQEQCFQQACFKRVLEESKMEFAIREEEFAKEELQKKIADKIAKQVARTGQMSLF